MVNKTVERILIIKINTTFILLFFSPSIEALAVLCRDFFGVGESGE
jgi:hypothetical protein